jgi:hypothetical protein
MKENWKIYPRNPVYEVSNLGRVRRAVSYITSTTGLVGKEHVMASRTEPKRKNGQLFVCLARQGKYPQKTSVAKMVLISFVSYPPYKNSSVGYKDGNKRNCRIDNLYWVPRKEKITTREKLKQISNDGERWKLFPKQDRYWISNKGRVYSSKSGKVSKQSRKYRHKREVRLSYRSKKYLPSDSIARLVLLAWRGDPPMTGDLYIASHIDGDSSNNDLTNLKWAPRRLGYYQISLDLISAQKQINYAERKVKRIEDKLERLQKLGIHKQKHKLTMRDTLRLRESVEILKRRKERLE